MSEVYELYDADYDDYWVHGIFSSLEAAQVWAIEHPDNRYEGIKKHTVDKPEEMEELSVYFDARLLTWKGR